MKNNLKYSWSQGTGVGLIGLAAAQFSLATMGVCLAEDAKFAQARNGKRKTEETKEPQRPNVLFIFSDDHALRTIGAYSDDFDVTPNIDRIAHEGIIFTNSFCGNSISQPSRATILTGKHSHKNGVILNGSPWNGQQTVFTRLLKDVGYQTALFGKWHLHPAPTDEFDVWEIITGAGGQGFYYNPEYLTQQGVVKREGYITDITTDRTLEWLEDERDTNKPFFVMCQYKAPHVPRMPPLRNLERFKGEKFPEPATLFDNYKTRTHSSTAWMMINGIPDQGQNIFPPEDQMDFSGNKLPYLSRMSSEVRHQYLTAYAEENEEFQKKRAAGELEGDNLTRYRYQRFIRDYLRCVVTIDENVGRLLAYVDEHGLADDTIVIYSSDQGYFTGEHSWAEKRWMYDEAMKMPLLIRWPGHIQPGLHPATMVQNIDYAPTFLDIAGVDIPDEMQGRSLQPAFTQEIPDDWRRIVYYHYYHHGAHNVPRHDGVRTDSSKLIHFYTDDTWELYDLLADPNELNNIYDKPGHAKLQQRMTAELFRLRRMHDVPRPPQAKAWM